MRRPSSSNCTRTCFRLSCAGPLRYHLKSKQMRNEIQSAAAEPVIKSDGQINWPLWLIIFGFWTFFSFLYANQIYFEMLHNPNMHHSWWRIAFWQLLVWYVWGFLSPLILTLGRRFPLEGKARLRGLLVHIVACVVLSALHVGVATALRMILRPVDVWGHPRSLPPPDQDG